MGGIFTPKATPNRQLWSESSHKTLNSKIPIPTDIPLQKISKTVSRDIPYTRLFPNRHLCSIINNKEEIPAESCVKKGCFLRIEKIKKIFQKPIDNCLNVCYNSVNDKPSVRYIP